MKKVVRLLLCLVLVVSFGISVNAEQPVKIMIDNEYVEFNDSLGYPFLDENSRTQVPFRVTLEKFGATVSWDSESNSAVAEKDGIIVKAPIGTDYIYKNDTRIQNDTKSVLKDGRTYLPIRVVLEAFGADIGWDGTNHAVIVESSPVLTVHFIDVGQADSIFIDYGDYDILIDGGNNGDGQLVVDYLKSLNTDDIEIVIGTHNHEDHIGGLDDVINAFGVETIIDSGNPSDTATYRDYWTSVEKENAKYMEDKDMTFDLDENIQFKILELGDDYENTNDNSVVSMLDYNDIEFLFTGDLESDVEKENLNKFEDIDILKVGHHGSKSSSSMEFLNVVKPEVAVISAGEDNRYGHPHLEALVALGNLVDAIYGTWQSGNVVISTNGSTYDVNTNDNVPVVQQSIQMPTVEEEMPIGYVESDVAITSIDLDKEIVSIKNLSNKDIDMTGWKLVSEKGNQIFDFPSGYILKASSTVEIVSGRSAEGNGVNKLKWTGSYMWNNDGDVGILYDSNGRELSRY